MSAKHVRRYPVPTQNEIDRWNWHMDYQNQYIGLIPYQTGPRYGQMLAQLGGRR